jgi:molybdate/tungstate transport system substrate-binding protein
MRKITLLALILFSFSLAFPQKPKITGDLVIFHAGSLAVPMKKMIEAFNKEYPNVNVKAEAAGSVASARKITDLNRECDILASADYQVIDKMLVPKYADWNIRFASNEMAIVYTPQSKYADKITRNNWYDILLKKDVLVGRADPNSDPCGYRTVLTCKLAEKYYKRVGIADKLLAKDHNMMRPKEVDLLALLETQSVDYIFIYKSVAIQHGLKYLTLPDNINLKKPAFNKFYSMVNVEINGDKPGEKVIQNGEAMIYGLTILKNAPNKAAAEAFVKFMLDKNKGMKIMQQCGQPSVIPSQATGYEKLPAELKKFATGNQ